MSINRRVSIGTISHATLQPQDLCESFAVELKRLRGTLPLSIHKELVAARKADDRYSHLWPELLEQFINILDTYAPAYTYFGTHEGNGSDFGFWVDWNSVNEDRANGTLISLSDLADADSANLNKLSHFMVVNDHGNASMYYMAGFKNPSAAKLLWSVV